MAIFNKKEIAKQIYINETRVYNFVGGEDDKFTIEQIDAMSDKIRDTTKLALTELEGIKDEKRRKLNAQDN